MWLREKEGGRGRECVDGRVYFNRRTVGPFWKPAGGQRERGREWEEEGFIVGWLWGLVGQRKFGGRALESSWPCAQGSTSLDSKARPSGDSKEEKKTNQKKSVLSKRSLSFVQHYRLTFYTCLELPFCLQENWEMAAAPAFRDARFNRIVFKSFSWIDQTRRQRNFESDFCSGRWTSNENENFWSSTLNESSKLDLSFLLFYLKKNWKKQKLANNADSKLGELLIFFGCCKNAQSPVRKVSKSCGHDDAKMLLLRRSQTWLSNRGCHPALSVAGGAPGRVLHGHPHLLSGQPRHVPLQCKNQHREKL